METHNFTEVDGGTGMVVRSEELDNGFNERILALNNPWPKGRPCIRRVKSQRQEVKMRRCSKYGEIGHYKNTCWNPRVFVDGVIVGVIVLVEDLIAGNHIYIS